MHRSHWDIEVYAKDFQERRWQEAARRRLTDEAAGHAASPVAMNAFNLAVARWLRAWQARLAPKHAATVAEPVAEPAAARRTGAAALPNRPKPARLAQPYADMVIVARGPMVGVAEEPSGVSDC